MVDWVQSFILSLVVIEVGKVKRIQKGLELQNNTGQNSVKLAAYVEFMKNVV
jgi:hypothetical protein